MIEVGPTCLDDFAGCHSEPHSPHLDYCGGAAGRTEPRSAAAGRSQLPAAGAPLSPGGNPSNSPSASAPLAGLHRFCLEIRDEPYTWGVRVSCQQCPICPDDILLALRRVPLGGKGCPSGGDPLPAEDVPPCLPSPHLPFPGIFRKCRLGVRGVCKEGPCLAAAPRSISLPPCPTPLLLSEWDIGLGCVWRHLSEPCAGREVGDIKEVPRSPKEKKKVASRGQGKVHRPIFGPGGGEKGGPSGQTWSGGRCAPFPPQTLKCSIQVQGGRRAVAEDRLGGGRPPVHLSVCPTGLGPPRENIGF